MAMLAVLVVLVMVAVGSALSEGHPSGRLAQFSWTTAALFRKPCWGGHRRNLNSSLKLPGTLVLGIRGPTA